MNIKMLFTTLFTAVMVLFQPLSLYAAAKSCDDFLSERGREANILEALHRAAKDDYAVEVFTKEVNGQKRMLVLMGEVHIKSPESAAVGREVVNNFDYIGYEGYDPAKTWGGRFKGNVVSPALSKLGIKDRPQFWFARWIGTIIGKSGRSEGSTITEANVAKMRNTMVNKLRSMPAQQRADLITTLESIPEEDRSSGLSIGGLSLFSIGEILDLAKSINAGSKLPVANGPKENFHLEAGHKPDVWENIDSIDRYVTVGLLAGFYAAAAFIPPDLAAHLSYAVDAVTAYSVAGNLLSTSRFQTAAWYQRLFPMSLGILRGRNATMVRNIESTFDSRDEVGQLLAIVGKAHVPEMKLLLQQRGYTSIPLPGTAQMQLQDAMDATAKP